MKYFLATILARIIRFTSVTFNLGGGTTLPGRVALRLCPNILARLGKKFTEVILVTGVNGKTTTARMIAHGLKKVEPYDCQGSTLDNSDERKIVQNRTGGNLLWGIVSCALSAQKNSVAVLEVDEAAIFQVVKFLKPDLVLFHNLGRDQLDRYGEIDNIWKKWVETVKNLSKECKIILNADDPFCASLGKFAKGKVFSYGVNDVSVMSSSRPAYADARLCLECGHPLKYKKILISHSGFFYCEKCKFKRLEPAVAAGKISVLENSSKMVVRAGKSGVVLSVPLVGLFNAVNALAAATTLMALGINLEKIAQKISTFSAAFGRFEKIKVGNKNIEIMLIKNPAGATEVLKEIKRTSGQADKRTDGVEVKPRHKVFVVGINDNLADGTDVSWLWDTEFELLSRLNLDNRGQFFFTSGTRALDMALRLKYAGIAEENIQVQESLEKAILEGLAKISEGETLAVLLTYTAMLNVKTILAKKGFGKHYWKD